MEPVLGYDTPGELFDQVAVMVRLFLAAPGDGDHILEVGPHHRQQLEARVDLSLHEPVQRVLDVLDRPLERREGGGQCLQPPHSSRVHVAHPGWPAFALAFHTRLGLTPAET